MNNYLYTLPTTAFFAVTLLTGCQPTTPSGGNSAPLDMHSEIDKRFSQHIAAYHHLPEVESVDLQNVQTALDGTTQQEVMRLLAQLPVTPQNKSPKNASDSTAFKTTDTIASVDNPIVQNGALLLGVRSYDEAYKSVLGLSQRYQTQLISEEERSSDSLLENTLVLLTPPQHFEAVVNELREMAMIIRQKRIWRKDLTAQFIDLKTRITGKQEAQIRLNGLLSNTKNVEELLPLQRELDELNTELESLIRTTRALSEKAVFTTITVTIYQTLDRPVAQADFGDRFSGGLSKGWIDFKDFLVKATLYWPWVILGFIFMMTIGLAVRTSRRQSRQFQLQSMQAQQQWLIQQQKFTTPAGTTPPNPNKPNTGGNKV